MVYKSWDGNAERRKNSDDHDTLIALVEVIKNHVDNYEEHKTDNEKQFEQLIKQVAFQNKCLYTGMGFLMALEALPKIIEVMTHILK